MDCDTSSDPSPLRRRVGRAHAVEFDVVVQAPADAAVDLSFACMFEREMPGVVLSGGLLHLDQALSGLLTGMRRDGTFPAHEMDTLLIADPPSGIRARLLMVIGLGDPTRLSAGTLERATRSALFESQRCGAASVAFAPNLLDAGHTRNADIDVQASMLAGVLGGLRTTAALVERRYARASSVERWSFDVGAANLEAASAGFLAALADQVR